MDTEALNQVLQREKKTREYPSSMMDGFLDDFVDDDDDDLDIVDLPDFNILLDDFLQDLPSELMRLITRVFTKHGKNGTFPHREEVARKDPWLADQLLREMQKADSDGSLTEIDRNWFPGWRPINPKQNRR